MTSPVSVQLEPLAERHLEAVQAMLDDADVLAFTPVPDPVPADLAQRWLVRYTAGREAGTSAAFAIVGEDGACRGLALAPHVDHSTGEVELGYIVAAGSRRRGVGTGALRLLTGWAFSDPSTARLTLRIDIANAASLRVAERAGYVREGVLRSVHVKEGVRGDVELWSRIREDPAVDEEPPQAASLR